MISYENRRKLKLLTEYQRYGDTHTGRVSSTKPNCQPCDYITCEQLCLAFIAKYGAYPHE